MKLRSIVALTLLSASAFAAQEEDKKSAWDVSSPPGERRDIPLDTRSGTWMSVDVSPDGKRVVFDMLGDVYDLPIEGGEGAGAEQREGNNRSQLHEDPFWSSILRMATSPRGWRP